jgi:tetratricopeptide (TPR) repeat protein
MRKKRENRALYLVVLISLLGYALVLSQEDYTREEHLLLQRFKIANSIFEKGKGHFFKGNYKKAERELKKCLEKMPEHPDAYFFLSRLSYSQGDFDNSLSYIEMAKENYKYIIKLKVDREQLYIIRLQDRKREVQETLENLKERLSRTTDRREQSQVQAEIGRLSGLLSDIESRLSRPLPTVQKEEEIPADYYYFHGNIFFKMKRYQEASDQYQKTIKLDPQHGNAYNNLANLYYMAGEHQKALEYLNLAEAKGVNINPELKKAVLKALKKISVDTKYWIDSNKLDLMDGV